MKKKFGFIILMLIVSAVLIVFGKSIQNSDKTKLGLAAQSSQVYKNNTSGKAQKAKQNNIEESSSINKDINQSSQQGDSNGTKNITIDKSKPIVSANSNVKVQVIPSPQPKANITIVDTISGKLIIAKATEITGLTAAEATRKLLDSAKISYKTSGFGDTIYFSSINGLKERGEGSLSGWCFYINGKKSSVGAGMYKLNKEDTLEWKYLEDGSSIN